MDSRSQNIVLYVAYLKINKINQAFDTFFALIFYEISLSALGSLIWQHNFIDTDITKYTYFIKEFF